MQFAQQNDLIVIKPPRIIFFVYSKGLSKDYRALLTEEGQAQIMNIIFP